MFGDQRDSSRRSTGFGAAPQFGSTEHLASEVVAAYVDGELRMTAYMRASQHIALCPECAAAIDAQQQARRALRQATQVSMPSGLLGALSQIPGQHRSCCGEQSTSRRWQLPWWR